MVKKKRPKLSASASVREKPVKKKRKLEGKTGRRKPGWVACGFDVSMSSLAGATFAWDNTLKRLVGPSTVIVRWERDIDYFTRLAQAAKAYDHIHALLAGLKMSIGKDDIYIAVEEPWPFHMVKQAESNALKQQAQISGAFLGGLTHYGYFNIQEIPANHWRQVVAKDLGITIHHSKWNPDKRIGKFRAKEWALSRFDIPEFVDLIQHSKRGLIPRPDESKARAVQSDDRYEAVAIAKWMVEEIKRSGKWITS
jgi:hypothetical protein